MNRSTLHLFQEYEYDTSYYSIYCNVYNLHRCIDVLFHSKKKGKKMYTRIIYNRRHRKLQAKRQKRYATVRRIEVYSRRGNSRSDINIR